MALQFNRIVDGRVTIEANRLPTKTLKFTKVKIYNFHYLPHRDVYAAVTYGSLEFRITVEIFVVTDFIPDIRNHFSKYTKIPTDFKIYCGDDYYEVHKAALSKISSVFEAMLQHNFVETNSNKLEIVDFDFKTVEAALNACYGRPISDITVKLAIDILYFSDKYNIKNIFDQFEEIHNISNNNFFEVLRCAEDCSKPNLFAKCAEYYKINRRSIEKIKQLSAKSVINLMKSACKCETAYGIFPHALELGMRIDTSCVELPRIETFRDFLNAAQYAYEYPKRNLRMACIQFWAENKEVLEETPQYKTHLKVIKHLLTVIC
uniref:BTB domain-containing protein n=1 Tax=Panagrellus redivivus TaxID=6233 RepID=A0A7E4WAB0_PANRE